MSSGDYAQLLKTLCLVAYQNGRVGEQNTNYAIMTTVDEGRKRVIGIMAAILASMQLGKGR
jgi:hypothetical protein